MEVAKLLNIRRCCVLIMAFLVLYASASVATNSPVEMKIHGSLQKENRDTMNVAKASFRDKVVANVKWQMSSYPESRLIDLYKNFFQDKFGPGHIIADTASAGAYLRSELAEVKGLSQRDYVETTGWEGNFVRIDLSVLKEGLLDYNLFFDAFIKSTSETRSPSIDEWKLEWREIESVIRQLFPQIPMLEKDSKALEEILLNGKYVVHHSDDYNNAYKPHYRLISKTIYENMLAPELAKKRNKGK